MSVFRYLVICIILVYASLTNLIPHLGSVSLLSLTLAGLPFCFSKKTWTHISKAEKTVIASISIFVSIYVLNFVINWLLGNLKDPRPAYIDHRIRLMAFIPLIVLFKQIKINQLILSIAVCFGGIASGLFSLFVIISGKLIENRVTGSYHAIAFGDIAIVLAYLSYFSFDFFYRIRKLHSILPILSFTLGLFAAITSGTKGAWITIPIFLIVSIYHNKMRGMILVAIVIAFSIYSSQEPNNAIVNRIKSTVIELRAHISGTKVDGSVSARLEGWKATLLMAKDNPVFGVGVGNFRSAAGTLHDQGKIASNTIPYNQPHNLFLYVLAECGIIGFVSVVSVFAVPFSVLVILIKSDRTNENILFSGLIHISSFATIGMTESFFGRNVLLTFYVLLLALILSLVNSFR